MQINLKNGVLQVDIKLVNYAPIKKKWQVSYMNFELSFILCACGVYVQNIAVYCTVLCSQFSTVLCVPPVFLYSLYSMYYTVLYVLYRSLCSPSVPVLSVLHVLHCTLLLYSVVCGVQGTLGEHREQERKEITV